jgi:hypothetical protein
MEQEEKERQKKKPKRERTVGVGKKFSCMQKNFQQSFFSEKQTLSEGKKNFFLIEADNLYNDPAYSG